MMPIPGGGNDPFHNQQMQVQERRQCRTVQKSVLGLNWMCFYHRAKASPFPKRIRQKRRLWRFEYYASSW